MNGEGIKAAFQMLRAGVKPNPEYNHELKTWKVIMIHVFRIFRYICYITAVILIIKACNG